MTYLLKMAVDVCDENDARLIVAVDEATLEIIKNSMVLASLFQADEEPRAWEEVERYDTVEITPITDEEYKLLKRLNVFFVEGITFVDEEGDDVIYPGDLPCFKKEV